MNVFNFLTVLNTVLIVLVLVAGGWVTVRDYFTKRKASKIAAAAVAAKAEAERIEALVQERLAAAKEEASTVTPAA